MMSRYRWYSPYGSRALIGSLCLVFFCGCSGPGQSQAGKTPRFSKPQTEFETQQDRPPSAMTLYSMAGILATKGEDTQCEFVLRRCIHEHPQFTPAYNSLAELQMRQGRLNEALDTLSEALRIRPQDPVLLNNLGMCLLVRKQYEKALDQFTQAAGLVPESEKYRANMATALGLLGRQEESLALLQQVLPEDKAKHNAEVLRKAHDGEIAPAPGTPG